MQLSSRVHVVGRGPWGGLAPLSAGNTCNTYLLDAGSELALVDPGLPEGLDDVLANIRQTGLDASRLTTVLLTHAHGDHTAALGTLLERLPLTVYAHPLTRETLADGPGIYLPAYQPPRYPAAVHRTLSEGDSFRVGDLTLRVLHTSGHTPDGLVYLFDMPDGTHAFTGDTAIGDQPTGEGVVGWIEYVWRSNVSHLRQSLQRLSALELTAFYPGHGNAHLTADSARTSLEHCRQRVEQFLAIPALGTMIPEEF